MEDEIKNPLVLQAINRILDKYPGQLSLQFEGGNDSGSFSLCSDGKTITEHHQTSLYDDVSMVIDYLADHSPYGSFDGDFSTEGALYYDPSTHVFEGDDNYCTTEYDLLDLSEKPITIKIPKDLWFDSLSMSIDADNYEGARVTSRFVIDNGPIIDMHTEVESEIYSSLKDRVDDLFNNVFPENFQYCNTREIIPYSKFKLKDGFLEYEIKSLEYSFEICSTNTVTIKI